MEKMIKLKDVMDLLDSYYVDCYPDGSYSADPAFNQIIEALKSELIEKAGD